jgi:small subunit ribosomal protein S6
MTTAMAPNARRAREYETIYILRSQVDPAEAARIAERFTEIVTTRGGKLIKVDNWGRRKMAYSINKAARGVFVYVRFAGFEDVVAEIERNLRNIDSVIRYQSVLLNPSVDLASYNSAKEELEFAPLDAAPEEEEQSVAARLGLLDRPRPERHESEYGDEMADYMDEDDIVPGENNDKDKGSEVAS